MALPVTFACECLPCFSSKMLLLSQHFRLRVVFSWVISPHAPEAGLHHASLHPGCGVLTLQQTSHRLPTCSGTCCWDSWGGHFSQLSPAPILEKAAPEHV